ncbi:hypothetical protein AVEN_64838-1 [Araneus ventricosus]|uniref:Uncharacterized protein n=1 Tax=Araneus ventricosus TaxID=182803 RepID=A0A4Y2GMH2_ARAVE|nr:hypothetical protein AVEN_64838-1 [Araneus ventricosus]
MKRLIKGYVREERLRTPDLEHIYRAELKTRRQKPGESLQELAADVERLMSLAYAKCPLDVRECLASQYFVDAIRDEDTQHSTRLMNAKYLKSSLTYSMKYEAARNCFQDIQTRQINPDGGSYE